MPLATILLLSASPMLAKNKIADVMIISLNSNVGDSESSMAKNGSQWEQYRKWWPSEKEKAEMEGQLSANCKTGDVNPAIT